MENEIQNYLNNYESYLDRDKGFTAETRAVYLSKLKIIFEKLEIRSIAHLTAERISKNWLRYFWDRILSNDKSFSDSTRRVYLSALKSFLKFLESDEIIPKMSDKIELPRPTLIQIEGLNTEEQRKLREFLSSQENLASDVGRRNAALIYFLWSTGCRINEALQLDIHADSYIYTDDPLRKSGSFFIYVDDQKRNRMMVHINGKGKRNRSIPVPFEVVAYINLYLQYRKYKRKELFLHHGRSTPVARLRRDGAYKTVEKVFRNAGIEKPRSVCTHVLRHTAINEWIKAGKHPKHIIAMTGHSNEAGLEPYFRRSKDIVLQFANDNPISRFKLTDPRLIKMEEIIAGRHARIK